MAEDIYFFDTYAIIEILKANPNYMPFVESYAVLTKLNLFEVYYIVLRDFGEEKAIETFNRYYPSAIDYGHAVIQGAAKFRLENAKRYLSMTDCIGYTIAKKIKIKFLTGDKEFKNRENIEFVK